MSKKKENLWVYAIELLQYKTQPISLFLFSHSQMAYIHSVDHDEAMFSTRGGKREREE